MKCLQKGGYADLFDSLLLLCSKFHSLQVDPMEYGALRLIVLFNPGGKRMKPEHLKGNWIFRLHIARTSRGDGNPSRKGDRESGGTLSKFLSEWCQFSKSKRSKIKHLISDLPFNSPPTPIALPPISVHSSQKSIDSHPSASVLVRPDLHSVPHAYRTRSGSPTVPASSFPIDRVLLNTVWCPSGSQVPSKQRTILIST